ncbi:MAG: hypothetical protein OHK0054_09910 [Sideroxydans sp.]
MKNQAIWLLPLLLAACGTPQPRPEAAASPANDVVIYAMSLADTPYRYGGNHADEGFDCSGFVGHVFRHELGIALPRTSRDISRVGVPLQASELRPGDLVFYNTQRQPFSHVGIYIGDGKFVHAPKSGDRVRVENSLF